jgi:hypothetical protein
MPWADSIRVTSRFASRTKRHQRRQPAAHQVQLLGNDGRKDTTDAVCFQPRAGAVQFVGGQTFLVEIDASVPIDLQIEVDILRIHPVTIL